MSFFIAGTGSALPDTVVTNDDLAKFLDTSDEWIYTRTGIRRRRVLTDDMNNIRATIDMIDNEGFHAAINALLGARRIYVLGIRSAMSLAQFLTYYLDYVCDNVMFVNGAVQDIYERMIRLGPEDGGPFPCRCRLWHPASFRGISPWKPPALPGLSAPLIAGATVHRTVAAGLKGELGFGAAVGADRREVFTGRLFAVPPRGAAFPAGAGLVPKALFGIELLFAGGEHKFLSAFPADQGFVRKFLRRGRLGDFV